MRNPRKRAAVTLAVCAVMLVVFSMVGFLLATGKGSGEKKHPGSAMPNGVTSATVKPGDAGSEPVSAPEAQPEAQPESQPEVPSEAQPAEPESEPAASQEFASLAEQPATLFAQGQQPGYKTPADANMNLRAGPGTDFDKVAQIPMGTAVTALGSNADGSWVVVQYNDKYGWLCKQYLE